MVEFADTDMAGIAHFANYFRWMEEVEHAFFRSLGLSVAMRHEHIEIGWPRVKSSFEFHKPLRFEDDFEVQIGADLAAFGGVNQKLAGRIAPRFDEALAVQLSELGVDLDFGHQARHDSREGLGIQLSDPGPEEEQQITSQGSGVPLLGRAGGCPFGCQGVEGEPLLGWPPPIDGGLAHAGSPCDVVHAHRA